MASWKAALTMAISAAPVITRCSYSTSLMMSSGVLLRFRDPGTCTAPTVSACWSSAIRDRENASISGVTRHFPGDATFAGPEMWLHDPAAGQHNAVRLQLHALGYNLARVGQDCHLALKSSASRRMSA